jgi:cytochrome oxidase Cu insertion factor (SCO1/SenC/PrrC family)
MLVFVIATIAILLAYKSWKGAETRTAVALQRFGTIPDFSLTDQDGHAIGYGDLKGKIWVADFICTRCAGPGPTMSSHFAELDRNFERSKSLKLVTFTVDPAYDTPGVLKRYAQQFESSGRWIFLTGDNNQIETLAKIGSRTLVSMSRSEPNPLQTTTFLLIDGDGVIRSYYDGSSPEVVQRLLTDIGSLLREIGK